MYGWNETLIKTNEAKYLILSFTVNVPIFPL